MLGIRFTFRTDLQRPWLSDGTADWLWPAAERAGIPLMVLVPGSLDALRGIAERHPGLKLTIDHVGLNRAAKDRNPFGARSGARISRGCRARIVSASTCSPKSCRGSRAPTSSG